LTYQVHQYIRGIQSHQIEKILQFIYLGKATIYQDQMIEFLDVAKSLEIEEVVKVLMTDVKNLNNVKDDILHNKDTKCSEENLRNSVIKENPMKIDRCGSDFICKRCNIKFKRKVNVRRHIRAFHIGEKYSCDQCPSKFSYRYGLVEHKRTIHEGIIYSCDKCNYEAKSRTLLLHHVKSVHEGVTYPCDQCTYLASRKDHLKSHKKLVHNAPIYHDQTNDHLQIEEIKENIKVEDSDIENINEAETQEILYMDGTEQSEVKYENLVIEEIETKLDLNNKVQSGLDYSCDECNFQYKKKSYLNRHINSVHLGVKYSCDQCNSRVSSISMLNQHKRSVHEGYKYSCDNCSYTSNFPSALHKHVKSVHEGVTYPCDKCSYKASRSDHLISHMKWSHNGHAYLCDQCSYKATTSKNLSKHQRQKHGINTSIKNVY